MSASDFVQVKVAVGSAPSIAVENLNVPLLAAYHTHYADRVRYYDTANFQTELAADGFQTTEATYKAFQVMAAQPNPPSRIGIGRRANKPLQTLTLTVVSAIVGDKIAFQLVGTDGASHALSLTVATNPGSAVTGTVSVTNGTGAIGFSLSQTMSKGDLLTFASQPGVYYAPSANVTASTSGALTGNYTGTTNAATTATRLATLSGTLGVTNGSATVSTTASQVGVVQPGDSIMFVSQLGTSYLVLSVSASTITLTQPYNGTTNAATNASDVATSASQAASLNTLILAIPNVAGTIGNVSTAGSVITIARTDGGLTDVLNWMDGPVQNIQLANTTADPGIAADLQAIFQADTLGWYGLALDSNSPAEVAAAQAFIESTGQGGKYAFYDDSDFAVVTSSTSDVDSVLETATYRKCLSPIYNGQQLLSYAGASAASYALGQQAGTYTLAYKSLPGVPGDTDTSLTETQMLVINTMTPSSPGPGGKRGNHYKGANNSAFVWPGCTPAGTFADFEIWRDWLQINIQAGLLNLFRSKPRVPYTAFGLGQIKDAIQAVFNIAFANGSADPTQEFAINVPSIAQVTAASQANRDLPNVTGVITYSNAIQTVTVGITVVL